MSRTRRAGLAAAFAYLQFGLSIVVGIALVPFVLHHVGERLYGYWLASGEVLSYAAMADFGVMGVLPWMIAEADGRRDRVEIRRLISTAMCSAVVVSLLYLVLVAILWRVAQLKLEPADRLAIATPLTIIAAVTAVVMPFRVFGSVLNGLQDVRFCGTLSSVNWGIDLLITVVLLANGYGLHALAFAATIPLLFGVIATFVRVRAVAPDLLGDWPKPSLAEVAKLFREGLGSWLGGWGWRLSAATDAIVLASVGSPIWITILAMTGKLGQMLTQMSWVPGDSSLVGLAQLSGEGRRERLREAVSAVFRVYLALATAGACVVLAVNGAFVSAWVGEHLFGGASLNVVLAVLIVVSTMTHGAATIASVLGRRMHVGISSLLSGGVQVATAVLLARRFGIIGVPVAAVGAQAVVLFPLLVPALRERTGLGAVSVIQDVLRPWFVRSFPVLAICAVAGPLLLPIPKIVSIPLGGCVALAYLWTVRDLVLGYPPVSALIRSRLASLRLEGLVPLARAEQRPS
jgi:O-antigen/teichoic acid export membrane protein